MKRVVTLVSVAVLGTALIMGALRAQETLKSITEKRGDVVQLATGYRASRINGSPVDNRNKDNIGRVDDLIVNPTDRVPYVILSVGESLGMGTHLVAVPFGSFQVVDKQMRLAEAVDLIETLGGGWSADELESR
ncbi:PRC-barrel domain-containing protein [Paraburkholderia sp. IMGN_8]|uniref:PRC-barrel domain-containing protein n=1 Tax=Paraburkholderia sp. IMGN_8 TaxID=3136564 RepID=UPI003100D17A